MWKVKTLLGVVNKLFVFRPADPNQNMIKKQLSSLTEWAQKFLYGEVIP
jgi:hypothetical protein